MMRGVSETSLTNLDYFGTKLYTSDINNIVSMATVICFKKLLLHINFFICPSFDMLKYSKWCQMKANYVFVYLN